MEGADFSKMWAQKRWLCADMEEHHITIIFTYFYNHTQEIPDVYDSKVQCCFACLAWPASCSGICHSAVSTSLVEFELLWTCAGDPVMNALRFCSFPAQLNVIILCSKSLCEDRVESLNFFFASSTPETGKNNLNQTLDPNEVTSHIWIWIISFCIEITCSKTLVVLVREMQQFPYMLPWMSHKTKLWRPRLYDSWVVSDSHRWNYMKSYSGADWNPNGCFHNL